MGIIGRFFKKNKQTKRDKLDSALNLPDEILDVDIALLESIPDGDDITLETNSPIPIDQTIEIQIRTVLSEGWHEVEHDLRYKCSDDWKEVPEKRRTLNGTLGALETAEWAMMSLFDGLAYHHYRAKGWEAMLRHKFRLRLQDGSLLHEDIHRLLTDDTDLAKRLWRADRARLLKRVACSGLEIPWTFDNLVHVICAVEEIDHAALSGLRPGFIARRLDEAFPLGNAPAGAGTVPVAISRP